jgi:hypothetical protein
LSTNELVQQIVKDERHARRLRAVREAEAGQARHDDVERGRVPIGRAAMGLGVGEHRDDFQKACERVGPAMDQQKRDGVAALAPLMNEMKPDAVDIRAEVGEAVQILFLSPPVEVAPPIGAERCEIRRVRPAIPIGLRPSRGETGSGEALAQILKNGIRHLDAKRLDCHIASAAVHVGHRLKGKRALGGRVAKSSRRIERMPEFLSPICSLEGARRRAPRIDRRKAHLVAAVDTCRASRGHSMSLVC